jgi:acetyltransferase-like isoleucine patch superfamily enzyme
VLFGQRLKKITSQTLNMILGGNHTIIPDDIDCHIDLEIGSYTSIASGLTIVSGQHPPVNNPNVVSTFPFREHGFCDQYPASKMDGKVIIGSDVWIGQNVTLLEGVEIGHGSIVGAGSIVTRNVAPYRKVAGNPARVIGWRFPDFIVQELLDIAWWHWPEKNIRLAVPHMSDIYGFLVWYHSHG